MYGKCKKYIQLKNAWLPHQPTHVWACLKNWWGLVRSQALWLSADHCCRGWASSPTASHSPVCIHHFVGSPPHLHSSLSWAEIFAFTFIVDIGTSHLRWLSWDWSKVDEAWEMLQVHLNSDAMGLYVDFSWKAEHKLFILSSPPLIHVWFTPHFASSLLGSVCFHLASSLFAIVIPLFLLVSSWCFHPAPSMLTTLTPSFASLSLVCEYFPPSSSTFAVLTNLFVSSLESFLYSACHCHVWPSPHCTWCYSHWRLDFSTCGRSPCIICNCGESYQLGWCCFLPLLLWKVKHAFRQWSTSEYEKKFEGFAAALTDKMAT